MKLDPKGFINVVEYYFKFDMSEISMFNVFFNTKETGRILGRPWVVSGLSRALPDPIQWLPRVQAKERENHLHWVVNPCTKGLPEMNHNRWIWISQINSGDAMSTYRQTR